MWIFTAFPLSEMNEAIGDRAVVAEDKLIGTIKEMLEHEGVTHVEVHEGNVRWD